ncbi:MAG: sensor histidine kinase [Waltera sp.]
MSRRCWWEEKNAELLALHSQINPHFLFNVLESIRMHSILKKRKRDSRHGGQTGGDAETVCGMGQ